MKLRMDSAVSPVIGVLLMLVVTIIIAAIVSSFAGGIASDQSKAPQAALDAKSDIESIEDTDKTNYVPNYPASYTADNGILFEHKGGDGFSVNNIEIQLQSDDTKIVISNGLSLNATAGFTCLDSTKVTKYIQEVGESDGFIEIGDKFKIFADACYDASDKSLGKWAQQPCISWKPIGSLGGFSAVTGHLTEYKIIDKESQKVICQGQVTLTL